VRKRETTNDRGVKQRLSEVVHDVTVVDVNYMKLVEIGTCAVID
jgi:hypothetical protein